MNIAIIGYGQMGRMIELCAKEQDIPVIATIDPHQADSTHAEINAKSLAGADAAICFTHPDQAMENIKQVLAQGVPLVMGTTGWTEHMEEVRAMVQEADTGMIFSSNFSLGVNVFFKIVEEAARMIDQFDAYDVLAYELHHRKKLDSPSGTAITMGNLILEQMTRKTSLATERLDRKPEAEELHYASVRGGHIPGTHTVLFDSEFDTIELTHRARTRKGFAMGSLVAANWVKDQKGLFTERDMMNQLL